jgi:hypothetical protein
MAGIAFTVWDRHTIYTRMSRRVKSGVLILNTIFTQLPQKQIIAIKIDTVSLDSTYIKVHPDAVGALKKTERNASVRLGEEKTPKFIWLPRAIE